jgi:glycosyltransferase involved in cell wall biosynthesis
VRFKVLFTAWNCRRWLPTGLAALAAQTDDAVDVCVVDDASDDPGQWPLIQEFCRRRGWAAIHNDTRRGCMYNQVQAAHHLDPRPGDVLVFHDGDDRLAAPDTLARLRWHYRQDEPLMTYGSYCCTPCDPWVTPAQEFPRGVIARNAYRAFSGRDEPDPVWFNHLRSVRFGVFDRIDPDVHFRWPDGSWFRKCCDTAVMVPALELAGGRHRFVPDVLYVYTRDNPLSDCRYDLDEIERVHHRIFHEIAPLDPLDEIRVPGTLLSEPRRHIAEEWA